MLQTYVNHSTETDFSGSPKVPMKKVGFGTWGSKEAGVLDPKSRERDNQLNRFI